MKGSGTKDCSDRHLVIWSFNKISSFFHVGAGADGVGEPVDTDDADIDSIRAAVVMVHNRK